MNEYFEIALAEPGRGTAFPALATKSPPRSVARGLTAVDHRRAGSGGRHHSRRPRIVSWFSCGTASAVNTKLVIAKYAVTHDIAIVRCVVPEEHPDNDRFARDCEPWFGLPVLSVSSDEYSDCEEVWRRTRYMSGVHGARCTVEMKKAVRFAFEQSWQPDLQAFGYTADEKKRVDRFRQQNPEVQLVSVLVEHGLSKDDCH